MFKNPDFSSLGLGSQTATSRDAWLAELQKEQEKALKIYIIQQWSKSN